MILPDVNLLVFAYNSGAPDHLPAKEWWDRCLAGPEPVGLAWVVVLGFLRITTNRRILDHASSPREALDRISEWLTLPHFHLVNPALGHFGRLSLQIENLGTAGNLTTDAHLATLATEHGYILHTTDTDFNRFIGLKWVNPLHLTS